MSKKEEWRKALGFEGLYEVSNLGRIRRCAPGKGTWPGRVLKPQMTTVGYPFVNLTRNGQHEGVMIHRLVALAFLKPDPQRPEVNHKNGDKNDPRAENLEWVTRVENRRHARDVLGIQFNPNPSRGELHGMSKLTDEQVRQIRALYATDKYTHQQLADMFGISKPQAGKIIRGEFWTHIK